MSATQKRFSRRGERILEVTNVELMSALWEIGGDEDVNINV